jgi:hypothetical protein
MYGQISDYLVFSDGAGRSWLEDDTKRGTVNKFFTESEKNIELFDS